MQVDELKAALLGKWVSLSPEIRPSKNPDGTIKPFFLERSFVYLAEDRFELTVTHYADPFGKVPIARIESLGGHMPCSVASTRSWPERRRSTSSPTSPTR